MARTFTDSASGRSTARPQLEVMLAFVRDGDTVLVRSMDRLARTLDDQRALVRTLTAPGGATSDLATTNPYRYAGGYYDTQTGLTKIGARYYL